MTVRIRTVLGNSVEKSTNQTCVANTPLLISWCAHHWIWESENELRARASAVMLSNAKKVTYERNAECSYHGDSANTDHTDHSRFSSVCTAKRDM